MMISCGAVLKFSSSWYPGEIVTIEEKEVEVKCMKCGSVKNQFVWSEIKDINWFEMDSVVCLIEPSIRISSRTFGVSQNDLNNIKEHLKIK